MLWKPAYETGIPKIDAQHKELFHRAELLLGATNPVYLRSMLVFWAAYAQKHFADEEILHIRAKYPEAAHHRACHASHLTSFHALRAQIEQNIEAFIGSEILRENTSDWLRSHILAHDLAFVRYQAASGIPCG